MDYQQLLLALLPDLLVVVALFAALGVDYSRLRGSRLAKRYVPSPCPPPTIRLPPVCFYRYY